MKKKVRLKEDKSQENNYMASRLTNEKCQSRKAKHLHKQKRRKRLLLCIYILLILFVILSITLIIVHRNRILVGKWYMDNVTTYEFYDGGEGALILPSAEYRFTYNIIDDTLNIDFDNEGAKDVQYTFIIEGRTLTLDGGNATTQGVYVLTKRE